MYRVALRRFCLPQDGIMLASRTHWFRAIATFVLLYLLSAGLVALILWRLPPKASLQQPAGMPQTLSLPGLPTYMCPAHTFPGSWRYERH